MTRRTRRSETEQDHMRGVRLIALLLGLMMLYSAVIELHVSSMFSALFGVILLANAIGGDRGAAWGERLCGALTTPLVEALFWCASLPRRLRDRLAGRAETEDESGFYGDKPLPTLDELGEQAAEILDCDSDLMSEPFVREPHHTPLDLVHELYAHDRCDWFAAALREVTGWPVIAVAAPGDQSVHRLNRDPQGRLVDCHGCVTLGDLRQRYGIDELDIAEGEGIPKGYAPKAEHIPLIAVVMLHLPTEPFVSLRGQTEAWVRYGPAGGPMAATRPCAWRQVEALHPAEARAEDPQGPCHASSPSTASASVFSLKTPAAIVSSAPTAPHHPYHPGKEDQQAGTRVKGLACGQVRAG